MSWRRAIGRRTTRWSARWQMIWLLISGRPLGEVATATGYNARWVREVVRRYNEEGAAALADQQHANAGAPPLIVED